MKERPILFKGEMVRAILAGNKTQTRRLMQPQPIEHDGMLMWQGKAWGAVTNPDDPSLLCPLGQCGDRLWVKETWQPFCAGEICEEFPLGTCINYRADGALIKPEDWTTEQGQWCENHENDNRWRPSIFMPRYASRITLEITSVRVERLQEISEEDARAEGVRLNSTTHWETEARDAYRALWNSINGPKAWDANPWVWVISFNRLKP